MIECERLIELLDSGCYEAASKLKSDNSNKKFCEFIADYLLANGVIMPSVMVGDRVWFINELTKLTGEICEATVIRIEYNYYTSPSEWIVIEYNSSIIGNQEYKNRVDLMIGKTVFFTREAAKMKMILQKGRQQ